VLRTTTLTIGRLTDVVLKQAFDLIPDGAWRDSDFEAADQHVMSFVALLVATSVLPQNETKRTTDALLFALLELDRDPESDAAEHFVHVAYPDGTAERAAPEVVVSLYSRLEGRLTPSVLPPERVEVSHA
jgi:hypothetical protein